MPTNSDGPSPRTPAVTVVVVSLLTLMLATGGQYVAVVAMVPMAEDMGWPRAIPSAAYSLAILGMGLGGIGMGRWSDRAGVAKPVVFGACMIAVGSVWGAHAQTSWELIVCNGLFIGLLGTAAFFTPLMANATRWFTTRRGIAVGVVSAGQSLGGAIWPPVHRYVTAEADWRTAYLTYAIIVVVTCVPLAWFLRARPPSTVTSGNPGRSEREPRRSAQNVARSHAPRLNVSHRVLHGILCLAIIGCCVAMSMPMVHIIAHATDLGHSPARAAEVLALLLFTSFWSRLLWGALSDMIGGLLTLFISSGCQAVMLCAFLLVDSLPNLYIVGALYGLAYGGIVPTYSLIVREHFPSEQLGWRIGVVYLFGTLGMAVGGVLGGFVFDLVGDYYAAFLVGIAFNVANLALIASLTLRERPPSRVPAFT